MHLPSFNVSAILTNLNIIPKFLKALRTNFEMISNRKPLLWVVRHCSCASLLQLCSLRRTIIYYYGVAGVRDSRAPAPKDKNYPHQELMC